MLNGEWRKQMCFHNTRKNPPGKGDLTMTVSGPGMSLFIFEHASQDGSQDIFSPGLLSCSAFQDISGDIINNAACSIVSRSSFKSSSEVRGLIMVIRNQSFSSSSVRTM